MQQLNVLGTEPQPCSYDPMTGDHRTGCCAMRWREALEAGAACGVPQLTSR